MFVEELQGSLLLVYSDEFLGAFAAAALALSRPWWGVPVCMGAICGGVQSVLGLAVRWRRHAGQRGMVNPGRWGC